MRDLFGDIRFGWRALRKSPAIVLVGMATLAIGIGANVAIFSLVDEIWLRPMPRPQPERLVRIFTSAPTSEGAVERGPGSYPDFESLRETATHAFAGVATLERRGALLDTGSETTLVTAAVVSPGFFDLLDATPASGRLFTEAEATAPGARVVVLSYPFWRSRFGGDSTLAGRTILLDRQQVLVAGVLPRGFRGSEPMAVSEVWLPVPTWFELTGDRNRFANREFRDQDLYARLRPGATVEQANAELAVVASRLEGEYPRSNAARKMTAVVESRARGAAVARLSSMLLAVAALVLLLSCANVASLLLARDEGRRGELATRVALGAGRLRLARQLLLETALFAAAASLAALALGGAVVELLPRLLPALGFGAPLDPHLDLRALLFALGAAAISTLAVGVVPAWRASAAAPIDALKGPRGLEGVARTRLRSGLVVAQVALSMVLAVGGALLVRSLVVAQSADPGFNAHQNLLVLELVPGFGTRGAGADRAFVEEARRRVEALPGIEGTAVTMRIPFGMSGSGATRDVFLPGGGAASDGVPIHYDPVGDRFFELLGTRLLDGRPIEARDVRDHARVLVVNRTMASRLWPGRESIGQRLALDKPGGEAWEVIGVAEDSVNDDLQKPPVPYLYTPMSDNDYGELTMVVKTAADPATSAAPVRTALHELNHDVPVTYLATVRAHMRLATSDLRMTSGLVVTLGVLGLLLVAVGLHGLVAFVAARRTRELGVRLALGAAPASLFGLVVGQALRLAAVGLALGTLGALMATRALRSFLFGVAPVDPVAYLVGIAVILGATFGAAYVPARRATRLDPITALRYE